MSHKVSFDEENSCIMVNVDGILDLPTLKGMAADVAQLAKVRKCFCIINDLREARPAEGALDIFSMPKTAKQAGVDISFKRALVVGDKADDFHFLETVFINQGHHVKMFPNLKQARAWISGS